MAYQKQTWNNYNDSLSIEQNKANNAFATPEGLNHIEDGIQKLEDSTKQELLEKATKKEIEVERERISSLLKLEQGTSTGDAEIVDGKISADGVTYPTLGDAIRGQDTKLGNEIKDFKKSISILVKPKNLLNMDDKDYKNGQFVSPSTGGMNISASYNTSGFVMVTPGKKIILTHSSVAKFGMRFIAVFDSSKSILPTKGSSNEVTDFIVPEGVSYIRVSYSSRSDYKNTMLVELEASDNSIPIYEKSFTPYYEVKVTTDSTLTKENVPADSKKVGEVLSELNRNASVYKKPTGLIKKDTLGANVLVQLQSFPEMLKTGQRITYSMKFGSFGISDKVKVGFINPAYATYQSWLEVTHERVNWMLSGTNAILTQGHGLVLSKYLNVTIEISPLTAQLNITITTASGSYTFNQTVDSTRFNAIGTVSAQATFPTNDIVLSGTCTQFKYDTWLIGDSYFGTGQNRIGGRLLEWGFSDGVLIDGVGGLNSLQGYSELKKLLKFGTPKTLVWYLGMNDNSATVNEFFPLVEQLCDTNGIELIFNRIPLVPSRLAHGNAVNNYVLASGRRYIDSYSSVGSDVAGVWYANHLSSDGVHPDPLGAAALTSRLVADVPEVLSRH